MAKKRPKKIEVDSGGEFFSTYGHALGISRRDIIALEIAKSIFAGEGAKMVAARDGRYDQTNWSRIVALNSYEMADALIECGNE